MDSASSGLSPSSSQHYFSTLDFLSLAGIDGSAEAQSAGRHYVHDEGDQPLDDPSPITLESRTSSGAGHARNPSSPASTANNTRDRTKGATPMDVDNHSHSHNHHAGGGSGKDHSSGHATPADELNNPVEAGGSSYDAMQAGMLQHQLEQIHMQSPMVNAQNPTSPYSNMASMFLTSPPHHHHHHQHGNMSHSEGSSSQQSQSQSEFARSHYQRKYSAAADAFGGVLTPGPSGDLMPDVRMDLMSPMQLEMLARGEIEGMENFNTVPLLSPALSGHSSYASPMVQAAYGGMGRDASHHALQQLQHQQRHFQEQLQLLQEQQKQLQATAAAVAAATGSPYLMPQGSSSQQQQGGNGSQNQGQNSNNQSRTPNGVNSQHSSGGAVSTPSPGSYFSPLTSPALEPAVSRSAALRAAAAHLSPALHGQQNQRAPHSLSALSSPALNPVGFSGGAQQTLSPALEPQANSELADPEYLNALQGLLDHSSSGSEHQREYASPMLGPSSSSNPNNGGSTGPHRSLPAKSRPSPMMKPTTHRSHRQANSGSLPSSPMAFKVPQGGVGFLPPAAIDQRGVQQIQQQSGPPSNTPSPVDLAQIMPPPPVPAANRPKSLMPMTPASLMNLKGESQGQAQAGPSSQPAQQEAAEPEAKPPRAGAGAKKGAPAPKRGSRLVPNAPPKRALAIRPPGGGARKAAAAAAATEPENRRTSHKAAEQKRRDSLKAGFDELRLLLPPINTEALDPETGEPIPGSSAPRLLPKSSLVPDDNPNRGVSKVALLKFSNEYIMRLHGKLDKRDAYIDKLRAEVERLRDGGEEEVRGDEGEDLLEMDMTLGEEEEGDEDDMEVEAEPEPAPVPRRRGSARKV